MSPTQQLATWRAFGENAKEFCPSKGTLGNSGRGPKATSQIEWITGNNLENGMTNAKAKPVSDAAARLGAYVQQLRSERNLSIRALAARADVDWSWLAKLERGRYESPDARSLWRVARALEIETADLYLEAGFGDARGLPGFEPYLRAKYHLPPEAIEQLVAHFILINEKYRADQQPEELTDE